MKGILPLLFLCVTLYLADGHSYGNFHQQDQYHKSEPHGYREDRNPFHGAMMLHLEQDLSDESKGSIRTFQKPLREERVTFLEDRSPSVVSAGGFRDSSVSSGLGAIFRQSPNTIPSFPVVIYSKSDSEQECFIRYVLDLLKSLLTSVYDKTAGKLSSPKMSHVMVKELLENLNSVNGIEVLEKALLNHIKIFRIFFRMLRLNFIDRSGENPEMSLALAFFSQVEIFLQDFLDLVTKNAEDKAPSVRVLLEFMDTVLANLNEEPEAPKKKYVSQLPEFQMFVEDVRTVLKALLKGFFNTKQKSELQNSALREILNNIDHAVKELLSDHSLFDMTPGSADNFLHKELTAMAEALSDFLVDFT